MKNLVLTTLILAIACLGCSKLGSLSKGGGGGSVAAGADPKAEVIAASKKLIDLKSFSAKMNGMGQSEIKSQVDYLAPDRYHVTYLGGTGAGMELIYIGSQSYMKTGGKWSKMPGDGSAIPNLRDSFTEEGLKTLSDVKYEGSETIDGQDTSVYSYKNVTPKGDFPFSAKIYVLQDSGVPARVVAEYSNGMLKQMTVNYDTKSPVTIEPPIS